MALLNNANGARGSFWGAACETAPGTVNKWHVMPLNVPCHATDTCSHRILPGAQVPNMILPGVQFPLVHAVHRKSDDTTLLSPYDGVSFQNYTAFLPSNMPFQKPGLVAYHGRDLLRVDILPVTLPANSVQATIQIFDTDANRIPSATKAPIFSAKVHLSPPCALKGDRFGLEGALNDGLFCFWCQVPGTSQSVVYSLSWPDMAIPYTLNLVTKLNNTLQSKQGPFQSFVLAPDYPDYNIRPQPWWFPWALLLRDGRIHALTDGYQSTEWIDAGKPLTIDVPGFSGSPKWTTDLPRQPPPSPGEQQSGSGDAGSDRGGSSSSGFGILSYGIGFGIFGLVLIAVIVGVIYARRRSNAKQAAAAADTADAGAPPTQQQTRPASVMSDETLPPYSEYPL
ncbi:hypothetical protein BGZ73_000574 [Actinomortierella ambigua]|nr:hypothetical protein BGZ73_000574 [Actinomortierella ambigua]